MSASAGVMSGPVKDVSLSIRPGDFYTVLGPAGSGKTTLLRMLAGLAVPDAGRIFIDDEIIDAVPPSQRNVGMVFQQNSLWPHLSVFENVAFGLRTRSEPPDQVSRKVGAALAQVGLDDVAAQPAGGHLPKPAATGCPRPHARRAAAIAPAG